MGAEGADESTLAMLDQILARRRGTAPGSRARSADELAALIDRAGDLTLDEAGARVATIEEGRRGDPLYELLERRRAIGIDIPTGSGIERRILLTETFARYVAAFGDDAFATVYVGASLEPQPVADVVPEAMRRAALTTQVARREIFVRFVSLAGAVSVPACAFGSVWAGRCAWFSGLAIYWCVRAFSPSSRWRTF